MATEVIPPEHPEIRQLEHLAGLAMQGLLANPFLDRVPTDEIADRAILAAQALIDRLTWINEPLWPPATEPTPDTDNPTITRPIPQSPDQSQHHPDRA